MSFEVLLESAYKVLLVSVHFGCLRGGGTEKKPWDMSGTFE